MIQSVQIASIPIGPKIRSKIPDIPTVDWNAKHLGAPQESIFSMKVSTGRLISGPKRPRSLTTIRLNNGTDMNTKLTTWIAFSKS